MHWQKDQWIADEINMELIWSYFEGIDINKYNRAYPCVSSGYIGEEDTSIKRRYRYDWKIKKIN